MEWRIDLALVAKDIGIVGGLWLNSLAFGCTVDFLSYRFIFGGYDCLSPASYWGRVNLMDLVRGATL